MNDLLFIYGTLLLGGNNAGAYLRKNCNFTARAKIRGALYDIDEYPGLILKNQEGYVYGDIYKMSKPAVILKQMDAYEGYGPDEEQPNLYVREVRLFESEIGLLNAWLYIFNLPVTGYPLIRSGNYVEYLRQKKSPDFLL